MTVFKSLKENVASATDKLKKEAQSFAANTIVKSRIKSMAEKEGVKPSAISAQIIPLNDSGDFEIQLLVNGVFKRKIELSELMF